MKCLEKKVFNVGSLKEFLKDKLIPKTGQRFKSERHNVLTKVVNKIALSSNDDKRMQSIDSTETCIWKKQRYNNDERRNKRVSQNKTQNVTKEDIKEHNANWPDIPDYPHRIVIVGCSESGKTNALLNLINHKPDIDKIHLYAKDP